MNVQMHIDSALSEVDQSQVEERILEKLSRFQDAIRTVHLTLRDLNGPKGGVDIRCQIRIHSDGKDDVIAEVTEETVSKALNGALTRAIKTLGQKRDQTVRSRRPRSNQDAPVDQE